MAKAKDKPKKEDEAPPVDGEDGAEGEGAKKKGPPMMIIIIAAVAVLVLGGGGAAAYFLLLAPKPAADAHGAKDEHGKEEKKDEKGGHGAKKEEKGGGGHGEKKEGGAAKVDPATQPVVSEGPDGITYVTFPDELANMQTASGKSSYLKMKLTFECADEETVTALTENMPRIHDILQGFMSELRPEDLAGSQGNFQIRLEILRRVNLVLSPNKVNAVLIQELLIT
jgi:flagellar protein FliL